MTAETEIDAEHLHKSFAGSVAVWDVSFHVARGEVVGFLGPNGAGKSTTIRMLTGVFPPSSGRASIAGHDVVRETIAARSQLGYLPERTPLYGDMSVARYLGFIAEMKDLPARDVTAAIRRAMGAAGIEHVAHRLVGNLSKGYRQRVGIAQAILGDPRVLILDEPTSGLDPEQVAEIRLIRSLGDERRTVILSSHILSEVEQICSRVIILARGRILAVDEPRRLEERLRPPPRLCGARQWPDLAALRGVESHPARDRLGGRRCPAGRRRDPESRRPRRARPRRPPRDRPGHRRAWLRAGRARSGGDDARGDLSPTGRRGIAGERRVRAIFAVTRRELASYFGSWTAYVLLAVYLVLSGYFFYSDLAFFVTFGAQNLATGLWRFVFIDYRLVTLLVMPLVTMRLFAEERKLGTIELLWTLPVRDYQLIAGSSSRPGSSFS